MAGTSAEGPLPPELEAPVMKAESCRQSNPSMLLRSIEAWSLVSSQLAVMPNEVMIIPDSYLQQHLTSNMKSANTMFMDPNNPTWGWSWMERWMADRLWESSVKEQSNKNEKSSVKTSTNHKKKLNSSTQPIPHHHHQSSSSATTTRNLRKNKPTTSSIKSKPTTDEITKSRRHIIARSSVSDDESLASSTARRSNMVPTKSARGKLKAKGSPGVAVTMTTTEENSVLPEKAPAKKRLSCSASPAPKPRRSSAPPKVKNSVLK